MTADPNDANFVLPLEYDVTYLCPKCGNLDTAPSTWKTVPCSNDCGTDMEKPSMIVQRLRAVVDASEEKTAALNNVLCHLRDIQKWLNSSEEAAKNWIKRDVVKVIDMINIVLN